MLKFQTVYEKSTKTTPKGIFFLPHSACELLLQIWANHCVLLHYFANHTLAAILETENSQYFRNRSSECNEILPKHVNYGCKPREMLKFAYFRSQYGGRPPYWKLKIRYISATVHPIKTQFCKIMQIWAENNVQG